MQEELSSLLSSFSLAISLNLTNSSFRTLTSLPSLADVGAEEDADSNTPPAGGKPASPEPDLDEEDFSNIEMRDFIFSFKAVRLAMMSFCAG
jgi:hypothetical protein